MTIDTKKLRDTARRVLNRPSTFTAVDRDELACGVIALSIEFDACKSGAAAMVARVQEESKRKSDQLDAANAEIEMLRAERRAYERRIPELCTAYIEQLDAALAAKNEACDIAREMDEELCHLTRHGSRPSRRPEIEALLRRGQEQ